MCAIAKTETGGEVQKYGDDVFKATAQASAWLPRVQLCIANSSVCQNDDFPVNHYALVRGKTHVDLGENCDVQIIAWRPKALEIGDPIVTVYDPKIIDGQPTGEFARIANRSNTEQNSGCMYGPEFLIWVPMLKEFATFFMGSLSARMEADNIRTKLGQSMTLTSEKRSNKKFSWRTPIGSACSTPLDNFPSDEQFAAEVEKFNNPPEKNVEVAEETKDSKRAR